MKICTVNFLNEFHENITTTVICDSREQAINYFSGLGCENIKLVKSQDICGNEIDVLVKFGFVVVENIITNEVW